MPRLSIGLPVYNGERYISEALEALLGQTYEGFRAHRVGQRIDGWHIRDLPPLRVRQDPRVRYIRQQCNIGLVPNDVFVVEQARGELFKIAAHDDLYGRDLLLRCVETLDDDPNAVLAHAWSAVVDSSGSVIGTFGPGVALDAPWAAHRLRRVLYEGCHDYEYGVIRTGTLRRMRHHGSYHLADRTFNAELALHGGFRQVEEWLYFRREHPGPGIQIGARTMRDNGPRARKPSATSGRPPLPRVRMGVFGGHTPGPPCRPPSGGECFGIFAQYLASRAVPVMGESLNGERLRQDPLLPGPSIPVELQSWWDEVRWCKRGHRSSCKAPPT